MKKTFLVCLAIVTVVSAAQSQAPHDLYNAVDYQYSGTGAIGGFRSQRFSPTTAVNPYSSDFNLVEMNMRMGVAGESSNVTLRLYAWDTDYNTSVAGPVLAGPATFDITSTTGQWFGVSSATDLPAGASYLLECRVNSMTYVSSGLGHFRQPDNNGGTNNDAYTATTGPRTDREYAVRLTLEAPVENWELY